MKRSSMMQIPLTVYEMGVTVTDGESTLAVTKTIPMFGEVDETTRIIFENGNFHNVPQVKVTIRRTSLIDFWKPRNYQVLLNGATFKVTNAYPYKNNPRMFYILVLEAV